MAVKPFERYLLDKQENKLKGYDENPSKINSIEEIKESFQRALENLSEPSKPTKFFRSFVPRKIFDHLSGLRDHPQKNSFRI